MNFFRTFSYYIFMIIRKEVIKNRFIFKTHKRNRGQIHYTRTHPPHQSALNWIRWRKWRKNSKCVKKVIFRNQKYWRKKLIKKLTGTSNESGLHCTAWGFFNALHLYGVFNWILCFSEWILYLLYIKYIIIFSDVKFSFFLN